MRCFCSCIWGNPDPGPVRLRDVQQVVLDTNRMGTVVSVCGVGVCVCTVVSVCGVGVCVCTACSGMIPVGVYGIVPVHTVVTFVTMARLGIHQDINLGQLSLGILSRCQSLACG